MRLRSIVHILGLLATSAFAQATAPFTDALRGPVPIVQEPTPPLLGNAINDDVRRPRNYDRQPPTIPHRVDGYQVDKNFNKCLDCHARTRTEFSQAIPVSPTHYLNREGKVLGEVSTRRYFCMQCHVPQESTRPLVGNSFENLDALNKRAAAPAAGK